jgi:hypothetical protein
MCVNNGQSTCTRTVTDADAIGCVSSTITRSSLSTALILVYNTPTRTCADLTPSRTALVQCDAVRLCDGRRMANGAVRGSAHWQHSETQRRHSQQLTRLAESQPSRSLANVDLPLPVRPMMPITVKSVASVSNCKFHGVNLTAHHTRSTPSLQQMS